MNHRFLLFCPSARPTLLNYLDNACDNIGDKGQERNGGAIGNRRWGLLDPWPYHSDCPSSRHFRPQNQLILTQAMLNLKPCLIFSAIHWHDSAMCRNDVVCVCFELLRCSSSTSSVSNCGLNAGSFMYINAMSYLKPSQTSQQFMAGVTMLSSQVSILRCNAGSYMFHSSFPTISQVGEKGGL